MNRFKEPLLIALGIAVVYGIILYFVIQESRQCDTQVTLTNGEAYECRDVNSFHNGMSCIKLCDGNSIDVPTIRIKEVTRK